MVKTTINESWTNWTKRQIQLGKSIDSIEQVLRRENYSDSIIQNLLYKKTENDKIEYSDVEDKTREIIPMYHIQSTPYTIANLKLTGYDVVHLHSAPQPKIMTISNFISEDDCDHLINLAKPRMKRALVSADKTGVVSQGRTGLNCWIPHKTDSVTLDIGTRIAQILNMPLENAESFQMIYYGITQEYRNHYDGWAYDNSEKSNRNFAKGGQRLWTALCYLNTVEEGGGTDFPRLKTSVKAEKGKLVLFQDVYDGRSERHLLSEHAGMPVIKGEKYAFNLWFRENKFVG